MTGKIDCVINASLKVIKCAKSWNKVKAIYFKGETLPSEQGHLFQKNKKGTKVENSWEAFWEQGKSRFFYFVEQQNKVIHLKWWNFLFENKKHIFY